MYYRTEIGNLLYEDNKMVISDDTVKANFARTAEELMPDSKYWDIQEVNLREYFPVIQSYIDIRKSRPFWID